MCEDHRLAYKIAFTPVLVKPDRQFARFAREGGLGTNQFLLAEFWSKTKPNARSRTRRTRTACQGDPRPRTQSIIPGAMPPRMGASAAVISIRSGAGWRDWHIAFGSRSPDARGWPFDQLRVNLGSCERGSPRGGKLVTFYRVWRAAAWCVSVRESAMEPALVQALRRA